MRFLRGFHRRAPFLFNNGVTFSAIGRAISDTLFADLPGGRRQTLVSAIADYISGTLDEPRMIEEVDACCREVHFEVGMKVETLKGSLRGTVQRILEDGRIVLSPEGGSMELIAMADSLRPV